MLNLREWQIIGSQVILMLEANGKILASYFFFVFYLFYTDISILNLYLSFCSSFLISISK